MSTYTAQYPRTVRRTEDYVRRVAAVVDDADINYLSITGRAKTPASFSDKAARRLQQFGPEGFDPIRDITDQIGVRIITYVQSDIAPLAQLLAEHFTVLEDRDMGLETASEGRFGYASRHMLISDDPDATGYDPKRCASVQLRTVLQHAWAEFEHDARYKGEVPTQFASELDRRFTLAAGLIELADREFSLIRDTLATTSAVTRFEADGLRVDPRELASFLAGRYEDSRFSRPDHYVEATHLLAELGISSINELRSELTLVNSERTQRAMGYRHAPGAVRRLEDDLLARFRERFVDLPTNSERREALRGRLQRLGSTRADS